MNVPVPAATGKRNTSPASYANLLNLPRPTIAAERTLSCAQFPLARRPINGCTQYVALTEAAQPSRQSAVPASLRLAAPDKPPKAAAAVRRSPLTRDVACARATAGATARVIAMVREERRRDDIPSSRKCVRASERRENVVHNTHCSRSASRGRALPKGVSADVARWN